MKSIKFFAATIAICMMSFGAFAQSVTACASTIDSAEAQIAAKAEKAGASYKITATNFNNGVHMTAKLVK